jgi:hypothetical protein
VKIYVVGGSEDVLLGQVPPGLQQPLDYFDPRECSTGVLVARTVTGREVARLTEPLCPDDVWIIGDENSNVVSPRP